MYRAPDTDRIFFIDAFGKNEKANLSTKEFAALAKVASYLPDLSDDLIDQLKPMVIFSKSPQEALMSKHLDIALDMAQALKRVGVLDEVTMRDIETLCLVPTPQFGAEEIQETTQQNQDEPGCICRFAQRWSFNSAAMGNGQKKTQRTITQASRFIGQERR